MKVPFLDLKRQYKQIKKEIIPVITEICDSQVFINGPRVKELEENFANFCGTDYAVGCSSGTDALILSLLSLGIGEGDEVITTPFTFFATMEAIIRVGAKPVLVDIEEDTYNIDYTKIKNSITKKTKAIIPVHLFGQCSEIKEISKFGIPIIEDAAQAVGAQNYGLRAGSMGKLGCFSFFPTKNLGGFGDGGIVTTDDRELYEKMLVLRQHGIDPKERYFYKYLGGNFRLDALQAGVINVKLKYISEWQEKRRQNAHYYNKSLKGVTLPKENKDNYHVYNQYVIRSEKRDVIKKHLLGKNVGCAIYYPYPLHLQPSVKFLGFKQGDFPICEKVCKEVLALPIYPEITKSEQDAVMETIMEIL